MRKHRPLTDQQRRVIELMSEDHTLPEIAAKMNLTYQTVKTHVKAVKKKLAVSTSTGVMAESFRQGVIK